MKLQQIAVFLLFMAGSAAAAQHVGLLSYRTPSYVGFNSARYIVSSNESNAVITVLRTGEFREPCTINYAAIEGTARAGIDFTAVQGAMLFSAGESIQSFSVPIHARNLSAAESSNLLQLAGTSPNVVIISGDATLTIQTMSTGAAEPRLSLLRKADGDVIVQWPGDSGGYLLEQNGSPLGGSWVPVSAAPILIENHWTVVESCNKPSCFYRLRKQ